MAIVLEDVLTSSLSTETVQPVQVFIIATVLVQTLAVTVVPTAVATAARAGGQHHIEQIRSSLEKYSLLVNVLFPHLSYVASFLSIP